MKPLISIINNHFVVDCPNKCDLEIIDTPIIEAGFFRNEQHKRLIHEGELPKEYREGEKHLFYMNMELMPVGFIFENDITLVCPLCHETYVLTKQDYEKFKK